MTANSDKTIQRTLIVTVGPAAEQVGRRIICRLQDEKAPQEAVAVVPVNNDSEMAGDLAAGLLSISQTDLRAALAVRGWLPLRMDEVNVYLVVDIDQLAGPMPDVVANTRRLAQQLLGVQTSFFLLTLFPEQEEADIAACLTALQKQSHLFDRGIAVLGPANELGLRLSGEDALEKTCSQIVMALTFTPLRDAPDWLAELNGHAGGYLSFGLSNWDWSPQLAQEQLALEWARQAIDLWLAIADERENPAEEGHYWFEKNELDAEAILRRLALNRETIPPTADWGSPQPWRIRQQVNACRPPAGGPSRNFTEAVQKMQQTTRAALKETIRAHLDDRPLSGIASAGAWLETCSYQLEQFQDLAAGRQEDLEQLLAENASMLEATRLEMDSILENWPLPTPMGWLPVLFSPWRWPEMLVQYRRMQEAGKRLVRQVRQYQNYTLLAENLSAVERVYSQLELDLQRLALQVEEIGEMLLHLREEISRKMNPSAQQAKVINALWQSLENRWLYPNQEAARAAGVIGGLGDQLSHLDDAILGKLLAEGRDRMMEVARMTAVEALFTLYTTPEAQQEWWREAQEKAAPLWSYDPARLSESERGNQNSLLLVCAPQAGELRERLQLPETADQRWVAGSDRERIWILRLRGGIPDAALNTDNQEL